MDFRTASELCKNKILTKEGRSWAEYYPIEIEPEKCWGSWLSYLLSTLSTIWAKLRVPLVGKSSVYNWFLTQRYTRWSQLSVSVFPAFSAFSCGQFDLWFCELWKLKMMINPENMLWWFYFSFLKNLDCWKSIILPRVIAKNENCFTSMKSRR